MKRRAKRDPVTPELRAFILDRDGWCVLAKIDPDHQCRDSWGMPHHPADKSKLTIEHVKDQLRMGLRAPSDPRHCLALCGGANVSVPSKEQRAAFRAYLARVNEETWRCDWEPDEYQPAEDGCPYCAGRMCARFDGILGGCQHDRVERHGYAA